VGLFLQFGYADEGWAEVQATRSLVRELLPDDIGISVSYPLPGTRYHEQMAARLGDKRNWNDSSDLDPLVPSRFSRTFYQALSRVVHAELRVLRGARALQAMARRPFARGSVRARPVARLRAVTSRSFAGREVLGPIKQMAQIAPWLIDRLRLEAERRRSR
jgi:anaerobic magnesium-protoporphyrin IX monomethyl ester cyclase